MSRSLCALLFAAGCAPVSNGMATHYTCPDGSATVDADDATRTGFSAEDAWDWLESAPFTWDFYPKTADWPVSMGGTVTVQRAEGEVAWYEDWDGGTRDCLGADYLRVPVRLEFTSGDGSIHAVGTDALDVVSLDTDGVWFTDGDSARYEVDTTDALQEEYLATTNADPPETIDRFEIGMSERFTGAFQGGVKAVWVSAGEPRDDSLFGFDADVSR